MSKIIETDEGPHVEHDGRLYQIPEPLPPPAPFDDAQKIEPLASGVTDTEKRAWLSLLRSATPLDKPARDDLASLLERQWFANPVGGRPSRASMTVWQRGNHNLRALYWRGVVQSRRGKGERRDMAEEAVAEQQGVSRRTLQTWMQLI